MKDRVKILALFFGLSLLMFFNSCIKEEFNAKKLDKEFVINPGVAAPLGYIHYELDKILDESGRPWEITEGEDSLISLEYEAEVYSKQASELLQFPEIARSDSILNNSKYDLDLGLIGWYYDLKQTDTINLLLSGPDGPINTQIDSIQVDSLIIDVNRFSKYMLRGKMILTSPKIRKKYGNTWAYWAAAIPVLGPVQNVVAEDVTIILSHDPPDVNIVPLVFELRLDQSRGIVPAGFTILNYSFTTIDLDFDAIYGKLGQMNFPIGPQDMLIDFYSDLNKGTFHFAEPRLKFIFENSFGLPIQIITNDLYATSAVGTITEITGAGLPSANTPLIINYPTLKEVGEAAYDSLIINYNEANLVEALNSSPESITYSVEARTNPRNDDAYNFVTDESQLKVISKLILPIDGYTEFLNIEDSVKYNFADFFRNPPREIKRMALRLNFTNGFPVDIRSQIYLLDGNQHIVDSVFDEEYTIKAGIDPDGDGMVETDEE